LLNDNDQITINITFINIPGIIKDPLWNGKSFHNIYLHQQVHCHDAIFKLEYFNVFIARIARKTLMQYQYLIDFYCTKNRFQNKMDILHK
jgi:hypothetical protein